LLILGWFFLSSNDYSLLGKHVRYAVTFVSNFKFFNEAGYFDAASHEKWLLHTWSLSVEWQFYILLPIVCLLLWRRFGYRGVSIALTGLGLLSLGLSIYGSRYWPVATFYLLPARAWEMLAGGLVWWATRAQPLPYKWSRLAEGFGFTLITVAIITFDQKMLWPGYLALVPVVGAMLVLAANRQNSWLTANPFARHLGASSYSIYLWHWPLVVLLTYAGEQANPQWIAVGISLSILFGILSLRWAENPTRKGLTKLSRIWQLLILGGALTIALLMAAAVRHQEVKGRLDPAIELIANEALNFNPLREKCHLNQKKGSKSPLCQFGQGETKAVVLGDSHANAVVSAVEKATNGSVIEMTYTGCVTVLGLKVKGDLKGNCKQFNENAIEFINQKATKEKIIIVNRASQSIHGHNEAGPGKGIPAAYFDVEYDKPNATLNEQYKTQLIKTMCTIVNPSRVYLVRPIPEMVVDVPKIMARAMMFGKPVPQVSISLDEYHERHKIEWDAQDAAAKQCGVNILDPLPYLCHDGRCWGSKNGRPIYSDDDHLSEYGNKLLVPMFSFLAADSLNEGQGEGLTQ
ncbi:MAG: acyltransferase family protein, partial [Enterovibrio sp.]